MATRYEIQVGDEIIEFEGPDGMSEEQIVALAEKELRTAKPGQAVNVQYEPPSKKRDDLSAGGSFLRNAPHDAFFNWDDELAAWANANIPGLAALDNWTGASEGQEYGDYEGNLEANRALREGDDATNPFSSSAGRVAGVFSALPRAGAAALSRLPAAVGERIAARPMAATIGLGGTGGAVSGAGMGEEGTRQQSAALGAGAGVVLGSAITGGLQLAPAVAQYARIFFGQGGDREAITQITRALQRDGFDVTSPTGVQALRQELQNFTGKPVALADIGAATRARTGVGLRSPSGVQTQSIDAVRNRQAGQTQRLEQDIRQNVAPRTDVEALDADLVAQRAEMAQPLRERALYEDVPDAVIPNRPALPVPVNEELDAGLMRTMGLDDDAILQRMLQQRYPKGITVFHESPGHQATSFRERGIEGDYGVYGTVGQPSGFVTSGNKTSVQFTVPPENYNLISPDMKYSGSLREFLDEHPDIHGGDISLATDKGIPPSWITDIQELGSKRQARIVNDPILQNLIRTPLGQAAMERAIANSRGLYSLRAAQGLPTEETPYIMDGADLDVRTLDAVKRYLDDEIGRMYRNGASEPGSFAKSELHQVQELRDAMRERMRKVVPGYADYLDAYRGSSEMINALDEGMKFGNTSPYAIEAGQADRSQAAQELYRVGAARSLLDTLRNTRDTGNSASRILNSDEMRSRLAATGVNPVNAERLNTAIAQERQLNLLPAELTGAQTNQRALATADANAGADFQLPFNPGSPLGWLGMAGRTVLNRASVNRNAAVNEELLPRMLETNPQAIDGIINQLEQNGQIAAARELRRNRSMMRLGGVGGVMVGGPVALPGIEE